MNSLFRKTVFPNGLTLISERQAAFKSLAIGIWVKTGTRDEAPREAGLSHFLEHMLFKGTDSRSALEIARAIDRVGGDLNAFTAREYTCFHVTVLARDAEMALGVLADIVLNSDFDAEEFTREKKVIMQEVAMVDESPEEVAYDYFYELAYGGHGLGRPILGTVSSIRRTKRADMLRYFRKQYRPDQMIVSVSGDVPHAKLEKWLAPLRKGAWPGRKAVTASARRALAAQPAAVVPSPRLTPGFWWIKRPTDQVHLLWGIEAPPYASDDRYASALLNIYLGGGMSSALFQEIREKRGLAYTIYSSHSPFRDSGIFSVYAATNMHQLPLCLKLIEESVEKLASEKLSREELQIAKDNLKGTVLLSADSADSRMSSIANNEIFLGKYLKVEEVCARIDAVSAADLRDLMRRLLSDGKRSILALGPKPSRTVAKKLRPEYPKRYHR